MNQSDQEQAYFFRTYRRLLLEIDRGEGMYLISRDGTRYLDMFAGIAVSALGHSHPGILDAIQVQSRKYLHLSNYFLQEPQIELARRLVQTSGFRRVFFTNSGTEAMEGAMKIARKSGSARGKSALLSFTNSFHGRTYGALSLMDRSSYREGYGPFLDKCAVAPFNDTEALRRAVTHQTAAVVIECIQGEGGIRQASREFMDELGSLRKEFGFLLIADEIQSGLGRTGKLFAFEHFGATPDLVLLAKALGGGLPLGAILGNEAVGNVLEPGTHGSTFGGNAVACAAGAVLLRELTEGTLLENVRAMGELLKRELLRIKDIHPSTIRDIRGMGLMLGVELSDDAAPVVEAMRKRKVLVNSTDRTVLRIIPALNIGESHIMQFIQTLEEVLSAR